ncbi:MAG: DUF2083 domain-containing protein [Rhodobacteraceae bacterium]|nr:DUF2083 domain-containing protein [Paracoccaceae bacterium]
MHHGAVSRWYCQVVDHVLCERRDCSSRAQPPLNRKLALNERERSVAIYTFEGE